MLPALRDAADDHRALRGAPLTLYVWLVWRLDVQEFRPVPVRETGEALNMHRDTVSAALNVLVNRGYLVRRVSYPHKHRFRLRFARNQDKALVIPHAS